jgi:hypothetical protein
VLEDLSEDALTETKERRIHVIAAFKMKDRLVWRFVAKGLGTWQKVHRERLKKTFERVRKALKY